MAQDPTVLLPSVGTAPSHLSLEMLRFDKLLLKLCLWVEFFPSRRYEQNDAGNAVSQLCTAL